MKKVTVIVRTKDRPEFLLKALKSIYLQDYKNVSAIIVNDGGKPLEDFLKDKSELPKYFLIELEKNQGRSNAANLGIEKAVSLNADFINFLDDDDILYPEHVSVLVRNFNETDDILYADALMANQNKIKESYITSEFALKYNEDFSKKRLIEGNFFPIQSLLIKSENFKNRKFDLDLHVLEDWDLWLHLSLNENISFRRVAKITSEYSMRSDETNTTGNSDELWKHSTEVLVERYRQQATKLGVTKFPVK